jgi:hypothetical protein
MRFRSFSKILFCFSFAALSAAVWNIHVLGTHHKAGQDCQVCAVAAAPELNSDCGTDLLPRPTDFKLLRPEALLLTAFSVSDPVFLGRAPPAA